jgi:hypothetical protein
VQLDPVLQQQVDQVEGVRALGVPGDLGALPGGQARVDALLLAGEPFLELRDLVARLERLFRGAQLRDPILELEEPLRAALPLSTRGRRPDPPRAP